MTNGDCINMAKELAQECGVKELPPVVNYCSTGSTLLDYAISNKRDGGIPLGRIVHIFGGTGTCKSVMASTILGYAQRAGMLSYYGDLERTFDSKFATLYGLDYNNLTNVEDFVEGNWPETLEAFFDEWLTKIIYSDGIKKKKLDTRSKIIVTDTVTVLPAKIEMEKKMDEQGFGAYRAKQLHLGFRKYLKAIVDSNTTLVVIDQTRDNVKSSFGGEIVPGGRALEFEASVRVYLKIDTIIKNSSDKVIGIWVNFRIDKNKVGPPLREGRFRILFDYGLDDISSNIYFLSEQIHGEKEGQKLTAKLSLFEEEKTLKSWIPYIEENNLEDKLKDEVWRVWQEVYKTEKRKERVW